MLCERLAECKIERAPGEAQSCKECCNGPEECYGPGYETSLACAEKTTDCASFAKCGYPAGND